MKKNTFLFARKENRRIFTPVITAKANKMTTYGGNQKLPRAYKRTAPTKYDYFTALQNAGIVYRLSTPVNALKARCEKEGILVK